ncbi:alpha/beta hydrolase [Mycolicibacterium phlei]|jgi:acetyl esterase|uniref:Esterase n=1 Tax=Mycolicibacterium phlei DSM 43239 = CCUG 21000 TaxID=1226750 RepID=A0A5N5V0V1_MYCPH|nr:alpha/beta hydrolase [Mycolicibacterium phlei]VEG09551.1 alpha/beta hydrolase domain-containing protein [Mycobacteroides chelonae]AMO61437.1 Carboxylesterase NlhH [Mycolicibacterium phlei]KAB7755278.1 esterase [Mycolicibacterium phlei DSM 43239 = CCUG 21000]KXW64724.1 esterase [Mycolicibacterium phlei DSM 43239 = CCUG 21000]KXW67644.1 esterase [Mycolicibacterium phlei DSM 43072]
MTLDPQIADLIEALDSGFPAVHTMSGAEARAVIRSRFVPPADPEPVGSVTDLDIPGPDGGLPVPVRIYHPDADGPLPILVYAHGGGWVFCDLDSHDGLCRNLSNLLSAVVISVHYRRAPESRWPAAAEDVYAATRWAAEHAAEIGGDADRVAVGGDSAGGNLAAVTALMARDRGGPALVAQLLLYPMIDANFDTESYRLYGKGFYNPRPALQWYWDQYVPEVADRTHPYASPLHADLDGLPPAVVVLAGHDPLRDEAVAYADALEAAGTRVVRCPFEGGIHGFMTMPMLDIAHKARRQASEALAALW